MAADRGGAGGIVRYSGGKKVLASPVRYNKPKVGGQGWNQVANQMPSGSVGVLGPNAPKILRDLRSHIAGAAPGGVTAPSGTYQQNLYKPKGSPNTSSYVGTWGAAEQAAYEAGAVPVYPGEPAPWDVQNQRARQYGYMAGGWNQQANRMPPGPYGIGWGATGVMTAADIEAERRQRANDAYAARLRKSYSLGPELMRQATVNQYWADQRRRSLQADADRKTAEAYYWLGQEPPAPAPPSGGNGYGYPSYGGGGGGSYTSVPEWWLRMLSWNFG